LHDRWRQLRRHGTFFWDLIHPTTAVHALVAVFAQVALSAEEPALVAEAN
jgi:phospholipase/lecithinase/hemolysin